MCNSIFKAAVKSNMINSDPVEDAIFIHATCIIYNGFITNSNILNSETITKIKKNRVCFYLGLRGIERFVCWKNIT